MAALRSLEQEIGFAEQEVERLARSGMTNRWQKDALSQAQARLRQLLAKKAAA